MGGGKFQLHIYQFFQFGRGMQVKVLCTVEQAHTGEQAYQSEIMITMQVRDEYMVDLAAFYFVFGKLHLGSFATVDQKTLLHGL